MHSVSLVKVESLITCTPDLLGKHTEAKSSIPGVLIYTTCSTSIVQWLTVAYSNSGMFLTDLVLTVVTNGSDFPWMYKYLYQPMHLLELGFLLFLQERPSMMSPCSKPESSRVWHKIMCHPHLSQRVTQDKIVTSLVWGWHRWSRPRPPVCPPHFTCCLNSTRCHPQTRDVTNTL